MKKSTTLLSLAFLICSCLMLGCGGEDTEPSNDCPTGTYNSLDDCNDAISSAQNDYCKCETEGTTGKWIIIFDP